MSNPYVIGNPLADGNAAFVGRMDIFRAISDIFSNPRENKQER